MSENKQRILFVEDDAFIRDIYCVKLEEEGFIVDVAENGIEAIKKVNDVIPNVVLLDIAMPFIDGIEILKQIKKEEKLKSIPVIMLTNFSDREKIEQAQELGADEYIVKAHFTPSEVVEKIFVLLQNKV